MACVHSGRTSRHVARCDRVSHRVSACGESAERRRSQTARQRGAASRRNEGCHKHAATRAHTRAPPTAATGIPLPGPKARDPLAQATGLGTSHKQTQSRRGGTHPGASTANLAAPKAEIPIKETQHCPPFYATLRLRLRSFPSDRRSFPWNSTERSRAIDASLPIRSLNIATQVLPVFHDSRVSCSSGTRTFRISLLNFGAIFGSVALFC